METRVRDLSQQGCYVDTGDVLPLGTVTDVRITKGAQLFEARRESSTREPPRAWAWYLRPLSRSGFAHLKLGSPNPERPPGSRQTRRSQRVLMTIPVRVSGKSGAASPFEEEAHTRAISAHGALILLSAQVFRGQRLTLSNVQTKAALECVVAHIDSVNVISLKWEWSSCCPIRCSGMWPSSERLDPRHPDAKSRARARESS